MRTWIGKKSYDIETAELIQTLPDGIQVYRKHGRSAGSPIFMYDPKGKTPREKFFDVPPEDAVMYIPEENDTRKHIRFSSQDMERIRRLAMSVGMAMNKFIMMLVDEYEKKQRPQ